MKLTRKDRELIKSWGYDKDVIETVKKMGQSTTYVLYKADRSVYGNKVSASKIIKTFGWESFLSGMAECAVPGCSHKATRYNDNGDEVTFDSSEYFKKEYAYDSDYYDWD